MVRGDAQRLWQIFSNLLINSVRFASPDGEVRVSGSSDSAGAKVCVKMTAWASVKIRYRISSSGSARFIPQTLPSSVIRGVNELQANVFPSSQRSDCVHSQAIKSGCHGFLSRSIAFKMVRSFRMQAVMATFLALPAAMRR